MVLVLIINNGLLSVIVGGEHNFDGIFLRMKPPHLEMQYASPFHWFCMLEFPVQHRKWVCLLGHNLPLSHFPSFGPLQQVTATRLISSAKQGGMVRACVRVRGDRAALSTSQKRQLPTTKPVACPLLPPSVTCCFISTWTGEEIEGEVKGGDQQEELSAAAHQPMECRG